MKNDTLQQLWDAQEGNLPIESPETIIQKAKSQRRGQWLTIIILSLTVITLVVFALSFVNQWNSFFGGLLLMISSLVFRIVLEYISMYRKEGQLIALDNKSFRMYLKTYYKNRLKVNYYITPICFALYVIGFLLLLPYFKRELSSGFYTYIIISGIISLIVLIVIIAHSVKKEQGFLRQLQDQ